MPIPPPQYDTVLLREHLYQDLKHDWLVIPPQVDEPGFKPIHEVGLGLFKYNLVDVDKISPGTSDSSTSPIDAGHLNVLKYLFVLSVCSLTIFQIGKFILKQFRSTTMKYKVSLKDKDYQPVSLSPQMDQMNDIENNYIIEKQASMARSRSNSPFEYSTQLEDGGLGIYTPAYSHSCHTSISSSILPPSLVNSPSSPITISSPSLPSLSTMSMSTAPSSGLSSSGNSGDKLSSIIPTKIAQDPSLMHLMGNLKIQ
ncbi:unnamed protein product [Ambrosiozyma monospora]|uniref:Unnamed protein product n=1 Tax=Ambrosiozyma monospora TaxID=43982 RepID=A0ACB5T0X5_AMBMO|nr:unnamed protein product [Ambrosiozyma monospora]